MSGSRSRGRQIIAVLVILLLILHQDNWFWTESWTVLGFLPIGLFWHVLISIAAALLWALATKIAWPLDDGGSRNDGESGGNEGVRS